MPTDEDSAFAELTVEEVMSQLEVRRAQLAGSASKSPDFFRRSVRGGNWTAANRGVVADIGAKRSIGYRFQAISATNTFPENCRSMVKSRPRFSALAWAHRLQYWFDLCLDRGAIGSVVFFPVRFGRVHGAALASHCVLQQRSTRSFGRGTADQTKVDGRFTRSVERDNLMKSSASSSHQDAIWDERQESRPKTDRKLCGFVCRVSREFFSIFFHIFSLCFWFCLGGEHRPTCSQPFSEESTPR